MLMFEKFRDWRVLKRLIDVTAFVNLLEIEGLLSDNGSETGTDNGSRKTNTPGRLNIFN